VGDLTTAEGGAVRDKLDRLVQEHADADGPAVLTNPINIGIGTK
jgi:hypothetical protein